jgi:LysM repeat protein
VSGLTTTAPSTTASAAAKSYTVASGDTLSAIAQKNGMTLQQLLATNPQYKANPNLIKPGQSVNLSGTSSTPTTPAVPTLQTTPSGVTVNPATGGVVPPTPAAPSAPTTPAVPTVTPTTNYGSLVNQNGTIFDTGTKKYYSTEDQLAQALGIDKTQIDWSKIGTAGTGYNAPDYQITEKGVQDLMAPTADETNTQGQIDSLESGTKLSTLNIEGQPVPMEFITGEQKAVEDRALALEKPLQDKLALLQAKRTGALSASQFTLGQMDKKIADAESQAAAAKAASKPTEVSNGGTLVDPTTGKVIYQAPYRSAATGSGGTNLGGYVPGVDPTADAWIEAVAGGNATMAQVPAAYKNMVALGLAGGTAAKPIVDAATDATVKSLIQANPNEWGKAADAIDAQFGKGTATKYDSWLTGVYKNGNDASTLGTTQDQTSPLAARRWTMTANDIAKNFIALPQYQLTSQGLPYLQKINEAIKTPGSITDQELLDSITKLSTAGNAISDAQVKLITDGKSYKDSVSVAAQKFANGGVLSDAQRKDLQKVATDIFNAYKKGYQPVYDQVTKQFTDAKIPKQYWTIPDLNKLTAAAQTDSGSGTSGGGDYQSYLQAIGIK